MTKQLALRKEVDSLAANLFGNGYMMTVSKWLGCIQELYVLSLHTFAAGDGRLDADAEATGFARALHRAYAMSKATNLRAVLREKIAGSVASMHLPGSKRSSSGIQIYCPAPS